MESHFKKKKETDSCKGPCLLLKKSHQDIEEHKDGGNEGLSNHADYDL